MSSAPHIARMAGAIANLLALAPWIDDVDRRRKLLDDAGELLAVSVALLRLERGPGDGSLRVLAVLRCLERDHRTLGAQVERALRERANAAGGAAR